MAQSEDSRSRQGANVHYLPRAPRAGEGASLYIRARIENYPHIRQAYGDDIARIVLRELCHRLVAALLGEGVVAPESDGCVDLLISSPLLPRSGATSDQWRRWLDALCREVSREPVGTGAGAIQVWVAAEFRKGDVLRAGEPEGGIGVHSGFRGDPPEPDAGWPVRYRADMLAAAGLLQAIGSEAASGGSAGQVGLAWQPIRDARNPSLVLYYEALARRIEEDGGARSLASELQALERLGFIRVFDHFAVTRVLDEIEGATSDVCLAANISARSAIGDPLWDEVFARLRACPDVARRFVVEITETSALSDISETVRFVLRLRELGCRVAIDDFGMGYASVRTLLALAPDIVKIDKFFLARASAAESHCETLRHLVGLAASLGAIAIVEGVVSAEAARIAGDAGARWQQGYHWGVPSFCRSWLRNGSGADGQGLAREPAVSLGGR